MKKIILVLLTVFISFAATAQMEDPVKWSYGSKRISATEGVVFVKAAIEDGWHIYSQKGGDDGPVKTSFTFTPSKNYTLVGKTSEPKPITKFEKVFKANVNYFENEVIFQQKVKLKPGQAAVVIGKFEYMTCNDNKCLPPDELSFSIKVPAKAVAK